MDCARVMRGMNSMAKAVAPVLARSASAAAFPNGSMMQMRARFCLAPASSAAEGRRTRSAMSAPASVVAASGPIFAPAAA